MRKLQLIVAVVVGLAASPLWASESACVEDAIKLCPDIPFGDGRVVSCLKRHWQDLTSSCQQDFQQHNARVANVNAACSVDIWRNCQGIVPGEGRVYACLSSAWDQVSSNCRDKMTALFEKAKAITKGCANETAQLCEGHDKPVAKLYVCLKWHESEVSSTCRSALHK